jgi:branched-chain amino acid transport system substrate-binding protein
MKKKTAILTALIFAAFIGCGNDSIRIGFIGPMSGDASKYGESLSRAVVLAAEEKNAAGGIGGKKIEVIIKDDEAMVEKGIKAMDKLTGSDKVLGIIGSVFSSVSLAIAPGASASKTVMISPGSTHRDLPKKGRFIFRTIMSETVQAEMLAKYAAGNAKIKTAAILYIRSDYSQSLAEEFKAVFSKEGGKILAVETALPSEKDFSAQLSKIKKLKPEVLYLPNRAAETAAILAAAGKIGLTLKILSADGDAAAELIKLSGRLSEDVIYPDVQTGNTDLSEKFKTAYKTKWGTDPDGFTLNAYDAAAILISAIEKAYNAASESDRKELKIDRELIRSEVAAVKDYPGVSGTMTFSNNDVRKRVGLYKIVKGSPSLLATTCLDAAGKLVVVH